MDDALQSPLVKDEAVTWLLTRIGSWTNARWDQHLRFEFGDEIAGPVIEQLRVTIDANSHIGRRRPTEAARHGEALPEDSICPNEVEVVNLRAEVARLTAALAFYADPESWEDHGHENGLHWVPSIAIDEDRGQRAKAALTHPTETTRHGDE